jgi:hypothetical protein
LIRAWNSPSPSRKEIFAMSRFGYLRTVMPVDASPAAQADAHLGLMDALGIDRAVIGRLGRGAVGIRSPLRAIVLPDTSTDARLSWP